MLLNTMSDYANNQTSKLGCLGVRWSARLAAAGPMSRRHQGW